MPPLHSGRVDAAALGTEQRASVWAALAAGLRGEGVFAGLMAIAAACLALTWIGVPVYQGLAPYLFNINAFLNAWIVLFAVHAVPRMRRAKPKSPIRYLLSVEFGRDYRARVLRGLPIIACVIVFMVVFGMVKSAIPAFNAFSWDPAFIALDRSLHGGVDPWRLLQPLLGYPIVTSILSLLYHCWFLIIYAGTVYFAIYQEDAELRRRYFISYFLIWSVIGMGMAIGFASVGPCFVRPILGLDTFDDQMAYLHAANDVWPVRTLAIQDAILEWYRSGDHGFGRGISAMPSMHVALAFLFFLAMRRAFPKAAWLCGAFLAVITLASVHLGYHYAIDGYVSLIVTAAIWKLVGLGTRRRALVASPLTRS